MSRLFVAAVLASLTLLAACSGGGRAKCSLEGGAPLLSVEEAGVWPKFRRDLHNTGRSPVDLGSITLLAQDDSFATCGQEESRCAWRRATGGPVVSSPVIDSDGSSYVGSSDGFFYAFDTAGDARWDAVETGGAITASAAIEADGLVIVPSGDGILYGINIADGGIFRSAQLVGFLAGGPTIGDDPLALGVVYVGSLGGAVFAVCPNEIARWTASGLGSVRGTPAIADDQTVLVSGGGDARTITALLPVEGETRWTFTASAAINASPALADDGTIYIVDRNGLAFALDPEGTRRVEFAYDAAAIVSASPAIGADGTVYVADEGGRLAALDPQTGAVRWSFDAGAPIRSSPAVTQNGSVLFGSDDGSVYALDDLGDDVEVRWHFMTEGAVESSPAVGENGRMVIGSDDGFVYSLRP